MANQDEQFNSESTPVVETTEADLASNLKVVQGQSTQPKTELDENSATNLWDEDKTEVLTESHDSQSLSAWLTDEMGFNIEMTRFPFVIGRSEECDLVPNGRGLSRRHAEILFHSGRFVIRDLDSLNGLKVNDYKVSRVILDDGDRITIGDSDFSFNHRYPSKEPKPVEQDQTPQSNNWLKPISLAAITLLIVSAGVLLFQQFEKLQRTAIVSNTSPGNAKQTTTSPSTSPASRPAATKTATTVPAAVPNNAHADVETTTSPVAETKPKAIAPKTTDTTPTRQIAEPKPSPQDSKSATQLTTNETKNTPVKLDSYTPESKKATTQAYVKATKIAKTPVKPKPAPSDAAERKATLSQANKVLRNADQNYLNGKAQSTLADLNRLGSSKYLSASKREELESKYKSLNRMHSYYIAGSKALASNDMDQAFNNWDRYLNELELNFPGEPSVFGDEVVAHMADAYVTRAKQATATKQYQLAYEFWEKAYKLNGDSIAAGQMNIINDKARQLYRQGLRQEFVNAEKAKKLWQQVVRLVPPSSEYYTKANAKLVWYSRWEN